MTRGAVIGISVILGCGVGYFAAMHVMRGEVGRAVEELKAQKTPTQRRHTMALARPHPVDDRTASIRPNEAPDVADQVSELRDILRQLPDQAIPEMALLHDSDWLRAADGPLESEEDFRRALSQLRSIAEKRFADKLRPALTKFLLKNDGVFPSTPEQLKPFLTDGTLGPMLDRYQSRPASEFSRVGVGGPTIFTPKAVVDSTFDSRIVIGPFGYGAYGDSPSP